MKSFLRILPFFSWTLWTVLPVGAAVNRVVSIQAPAEAAAGSTISVSFRANTNANDGEQIGVLDAEYSVDEGQTWSLLCSALGSGAELSRAASFAVNVNGGKAIIRVRVAFRGGVAGDVDYRGGVIQWNDSWQKWRWPPAKYAVIKVANPVMAPISGRVSVNRAISIQVPAEAAAGSTVSFTLHASTDASDGEQIGFLHAEYSTDGGKTWIPFCYAVNSGTEMSRKGSFAVNPKGGKALIRVRVAFRGGAAGDVDYKGGAIQWNGSWQKWRSPTTKYAIIYSPKP